MYCMYIVCAAPTEQTAAVAPIQNKSSSKFSPSARNVFPAKTAPIHCPVGVELLSSSKKVKMSDKPKRPLSAYMLWMNSAREQLMADHPGLRITEVAKKGGEMWRGMKDKSVWEEKAAEAKEKYTRYLESCNANGGGGEGDQGLQEGSRSVGGMGEGEKEYDSAMTQFKDSGAATELKENQKAADKERKPSIETKSSSSEGSEYEPSGSGSCSGSGSDSD